VPSFTSVKESVTEVSVVPATARFVTVPGFAITGAGTVIAAAPLLPSLVAVIVAVPAVTAVTSPLALTVATAALLVAHVAVRPVNVLPFASFIVADSCTVWPTVTVGAAGLTVTKATGTLDTVMVEVPLFPSLVAVIVAVPTVIPVVSPLLVTVAAVVLLLAHVTVRPVSTLPPASLRVAASWTVCPTVTLADAGLTVTDATGTLVVVTVMVEVPLCPPLTAVIVADPDATPAVSPLLSTVATAALLLAQVIAQPERGLPAESSGVAVSCSAWPVATLAAAGLTTTDATVPVQATLTLATSNLFPG